MIETQQHSQSSKRRVLIDVSPGQWREKSVSGSGNSVRIFNREDPFPMEEGGDEYVRGKHRSKKDDDPLPVPYGAGDPDWSKAVELERRPCGIPKIDHPCVLLEVRLKPWARVNSNSSIKMLEGSEWMLLDMETGLLLFSRAVQTIDNQRGGG